MPPVRDREAPGSNPGPPTSFRIQTQPLSGAKVILVLYHYSISTALRLRCPRNSLVGWDGSALGNGTQLLRADRKFIE